MGTVMKHVVFSRDCEVTVIPAGHRMLCPAGTEAAVSQALGESVTLTILSMGLLVRLDAKDRDAIGLEAADLAAPIYDGPPLTDAQLTELIWAALKSCFDPEIPVNIVDLGLVYDMKLSSREDGGKRVDVKMTLTAPGCGMGTYIAGDAQTKIRGLPNVKEANVEVVWEPVWGPERISPEGRQLLGIDAA